MATNMRILSGKKTLSPISMVEDRPENLYLPKAEFVEWRSASKKARQAAEKAYQQAMSENLKTDPGKAKLSVADAEVRKVRQLVATLTKQVGEIESELAEASEGERRTLKSSLTKTNNKLISADESLKIAEEEYDKIDAEIKSQA